jgi:cell division protein FtsB
MKVMRKFLAAVVRVWNLPFVKYAVITVAGIVLVGFVGENSLLAHLQNKYRIGQLADEIEVYTARYQDDMRQIRELNHNPKAMERIARERYFMKHADEDIFVLSDDNREFQSIANDDETAE